MNCKSRVANQLNNYLKKGALILVAIMMLTISNLPVYSYIGSYQTVSMAIIANNNYSISHDEDKPLFLLNVLAGVVGLAAAVIGFAIIAASPVAAPALLAAGLSYPKENLLPNSTFKKYDKYDFSRFDN